MMSEFDDFRDKIIKCQKCGREYKSACGFGKIDHPKVFFIGTNPWVKNHEFEDGKGITLLKKKLSEWNFTDYFFDNIVKCELPIAVKLSEKEANNCIPFLNEQMDILQPGSIILFGSYVTQRLHLNCSAWQRASYHGVNGFYVPHFSSIFYPNSKISVDEYYNELGAVLGV